MAEIVQLTEASFDGAVASGVTLVDFWATWCGPCKMMGELLEKRIAPGVGEGVKIGKVNVDDEPALAARFEVMSIPTLIVFKDGEPAARFAGVQRPDDLLAAVAAAAG